MLICVFSCHLPLLGARASYIVGPHTLRRAPSNTAGMPRGQQVRRLYEGRIVLTLLRMTLRMRPREYPDFPKGVNLRLQSLLRTCMSAAGSAIAGRGKIESAVRVRITSYSGNNRRVHVEPPCCVLTSAGGRRRYTVWESSSKTGHRSGEDLGYLTTVPVGLPQRGPIYLRWRPRAVADID